MPRSSSSLRIHSEPLTPGSIIAKLRKHPRTRVYTQANRRGRPLTFVVFFCSIATATAFPLARDKRSLAWLCFDPEHCRGTVWFYLELASFVALQAMAVMAVVLNVCLREVLERSGALGKRRGKRSASSSSRRRRRGIASSTTSRGGGSVGGAGGWPIIVCFGLSVCLCCTSGMLQRGC